MNPYRRPIAPSLMTAATCSLLVLVLLISTSLTACTHRELPTATSTNTPTPVPTSTAMPTQTATPTPVPTSAAMPTQTATAAPTATPTLTRPTATPVQIAARSTPTQRPTQTAQVQTPTAATAVTLTVSSTVTTTVTTTVTIAVAAATSTTAANPTRDTTPPAEQTAAATPTAAASQGTAINPLTGLPVSAAKLNRRPLGVKVPNFPAEARPQSGLSLADVVFEHEAEAYLTRFTAIFLGNDVNSELGPLRSLRLVDGELMPIFKSVLVASGGHPAVKLRITEGKAWPEGYKRVICPEAPFLGDGGAMYRASKPDRRYELTLYSSTARLWSVVSQRGVNQKQDLGNMWVFDNAPPPGGGTASHLKIVYKPGYAEAEYRYDAASNTYKRFDMGQPTLDALTGQQIAPPNIVVLYANHVNSDILADQHDPEHPWYSIMIQLWGDGPAKLMRDGQVYDVRWIRENPQQADDRLIFVDTSGSKIPFHPGPTWIQLVRPDGSIQID